MSCFVSFTFIQELFWIFRIFIIGIEPVLMRDIEGIFGYIYSYLI